MFNRYVVIILILLLYSGVVCADEADSARTNHAKGVWGWISRTLEHFSDVDTNYIEPQHYNYTLMMQATNTYDIYRLRSIGNESQSVSLAPDLTMKVGPYFGWRWFFFGYTFDIRNISFDKSKMLKTEIDLSIYTSRLGIDLFYRRTGNDYKIRSISLGKNVDTDMLTNHPFDGIHVGISGFNLYYIFDNKHFSYPAAFAQSTCQKRSAGSVIAGIGYSRNSLSFDADKLQNLIANNVRTQNIVLDSALRFNKVAYTDINISGGYAYNWVFAPNFVLGTSLVAAVGYKKSTGNVNNEDNNKTTLLGFNIHNFNIDGVGRFGLVYNNTRWYAGLSAIVHSYNYRKTRFSANNTHGNLNIYVGYNFGLKKIYRKKK